jgi:hypothetical protein
MRRHGTVSMWNSPATTCHREDYTATTEISFMSPPLIHIITNPSDEP